jgi:hypothetical protein
MHSLLLACAAAGVRCSRPRLALFSAALPRQAYQQITEASPMRQYVVVCFVWCSARPRPHLARHPARHRTPRARRPPSGSVARHRHCPAAFARRLPSWLPGPWSALRRLLGGWRLSVARRVLCARLFLPPGAPSTYHRHSTYYRRHAPSLSPVGCSAHAPRSCATARIIAPPPASSRHPPASPPPRHRQSPTHAPTTRGQLPHHLDHHTPRTAPASTVSAPLVIIRFARRLHPPSLHHSATVACHLCWLRLSRPSTATRHASHKQHAFDAPGLSAHSNGAALG